jgi:hypothetical protein
MGGAARSALYSMLANKRVAVADKAHYALATAARPLILCACNANQEST